MKVLKNIAIFASSITSFGMACYILFCGVSVELIIAASVLAALSVIGVYDQVKKYMEYEED